MTAVILLLAAALAQQAPAAPQPFPRPTAPPARPGAPPRVQPAPPPTVTPQAESDRGPTESALGVPLYPGAQFLSSYDAGRGQRFYLYGTTASFVEIVAFYRTVLKQKGELVFDAPATHQFDVGRFNEETMAFPPGVTIKDFQSQISQGYPNPHAGALPARFPTVIQIVAAQPPAK
jgi:hypothetical protein